MTKMTKWICALSFAAVATLNADAGGTAGEGPKTPPNWHSGVGVSTLSDPGAAADEAAAEAKAKLEGCAAKFVFIGAAEGQVTPELVRGAAKHFPADVIFGCQVTSPLVAETNFPDVPTLDIPEGVSVWAIGGDMEIAPAWFATDVDAEDVYYEAGSNLGELLRPAVEASKKPGKVIITFGDQYNGSNKDFAVGLNDGLGAVYPIVGAAAGNVTSKVIIKGEIHTGVNVAILLADNFKLGQAMNGGTHTPETADKTLAYAIEQGEGADPFFALLFNCRRRRQGMIERNQLGEELAAIKKHLPGVDFFGFYGPGEVGSDKPGEPAKGMGFTIVTAVFFAQ